MDAVSLAILERELHADAAVVHAACDRAGVCLAARELGFLEAAAFDLQRAYNVIEQMLERICRTCENHFDRGPDSHERLLRRLALDLPGLRPAFVPASSLPRLRELKAFRHLVRHAYDVTLREDRMRELHADAVAVAAELPEWIATFCAEQRRRQGWETSA